MNGYQRYLTNGWQHLGPWPWLAASVFFAVAICGFLWFVNYENKQYPRDRDSVAIGYAATYVIVAGGMSLILLLAFVDHIR